MMAYMIIESPTRKRVFFFEKIKSTYSYFSLN